MDGGNDKDKLLGGIGNDTLSGGLGADTLDGGADNDVLDGEADTDSLIGGTGRDLLIGGAAIDTLAGGANGPTVLHSTTVQNDSNAADKLNGSLAAPNNTDLDWFFESAADVLDAINGETRTTVS